MNKKEKKFLNLLIDFAEELDTIFHSSSNYRNFCVLEIYPDDIIKTFTIKCELFGFKDGISFKSNVYQNPEEVRSNLLIFTQVIEEFIQVELYRSLHDIVGIQADGGRFVGFPLLEKMTPTIEKIFNKIYSWETNR